MAMLWDMWKRGFNAWEQTTANYMDKVLQSPAVLRPAGTMLGQVMKNKAATDKALANFWANLGLPTKRDQERTLHALNQLQSKIYDLEEQLEDLRAAKSKDNAS
jgi:hypothetical protein